MIDDAGLARLVRAWLCPPVGLPVEDDPLEVGVGLGLSIQQGEALRQYARTGSVRRAAKAMHTRQADVAGYLKGLRERAGVHSNKQLVKWAFDHGWLQAAGTRAYQLRHRQELEVLMLLALLQRLDRQSPTFERPGIEQLEVSACISGRAIHSYPSWRGTIRRELWDKLWDKIHELEALTTLILAARIRQEVVGDGLRKFTLTAWVIRKEG